MSDAKKEEERALAAQAKAKAEAAKPRNDLIEKLVKAGYAKGNIKPHWPIQRLKQELVNHNKIQASRKAAKAKKTAQVERGESTEPQPENG